MEKQKRKLECLQLQSVQKNLPADSELRRNLMDEFVSDAACGRFLRTTNLFHDPFRLRYPHNLTRSLPEGITRNEVGIINLTAQFMAVYGIFFQRALIKRVIMDPRFDFMTKPPDDTNSHYYRLLAGYPLTDNSKFSFYSRLFGGYMALSKPCQELTKDAGASPETVLDGFFQLLAQLEDEDGMIGMVDLHVLEFLAKTLCQMMPLPPEYLSNMVEPWTSRLMELLMTPIHERSDDAHDKIRFLQTEINDASCRSSWRHSVSYHACYQQMQIMRQDHAFCEHPQPKDLQNNSDQGPADLWPPLWFDHPAPKFTSLIPEGITRKELGIIKLTAQFKAVYGLYLRDDIKKMGIVDPRFEFLKPTDSRYSFFSQLSIGYDRVLIPSRKKDEACVPLRKMSGSPPSLEMVLEGFWNFVEMVEEGVDLRMIDLHAFEFFANMEKQELSLPPLYIVMMMYPLLPPFAHLQVRIPRGKKQCRL
ncbi:putative splicing factor 3A subunit 1 [Cardamine amara subsp. amara]|uniref:Splicing factor 3A subunit 1 n=1 Tax=Cardamine amara subsp. amara TaxID=228776 RepID=A0ABD1BBY3_CARAN